MSAPSEAEIRAIVEQTELVDFDIGSVIHEFTSRVHYSDATLRGPAREAHVWDDLRPSEASRLDDLLSDCYQIEDEIRRMIVDRVVVAALTFATEHPDAHRAKQPLRAVV